MVVEREAVGSFSPEDGANVSIPCALGVILFEFWDTIESVLEVKSLENYYKLMDRGHRKYSLQNVGLKIQVF